MIPTKGVGLGLSTSKSARGKKIYSFSPSNPVHTSMSEIFFWGPTYESTIYFSQVTSMKFPMATGLCARHCCNFKASCAFHWRTVASVIELLFATRISENLSKHLWNVGHPCIYEQYLVGLSFNHLEQVAHIPKSIKGLGFDVRNGIGKFQVQPKYHD